VSEQYNVISVFRDRHSTEELAQILMGELRFVWSILGPPSELLAIDVEKRMETRKSLSHTIDAQDLKFQPGAILNFRGVHDKLGTVQCYEVLDRSLISVSRPFDLLPSQQRLNWVRAIWQRVRSRDAVVVVGGREVELGDSDLAEGFRDWRALRRVRSAEYLILSSLLTAAAPTDEGVPIGGATLLHLLSDESGGRCMH
jgi:hypothetical protein